MPNKWGGANKQGGMKKFRNLMNGWGLDFEKWLERIKTSRWKESKEVVIKHRAKKYTEAFYFALNSGHEKY